MHRTPLSLPRLPALLLSAAILIVPAVLSGCSRDDVLRSVYESARKVCEQADNCTAEED